MFNMFKKNNSQKGQSVVEYVLLLAVISTLTVSVLRSDALRNALGEDSDLMNILTSQMEYSYRHASPGEIDNTNYNAINHDSYRGPDGSRFFLPEDGFSN